MAWYDRFRRNRQQAGSDDPRERAPTKDAPMGRSGTVNWRGFITDDEVEADLRHPQANQTYETMRREDPSIRGMVELVKTPVRATPWGAMPASQSDEHLEHAAFVERTLFGGELDGGFDEFLRQALDFLVFGHMLFERIAALRDVSFTYTNSAGEEVRVERKGFVLAKLGPRLPATIERWIADPRDQSVLKEVVQQLPDGHDPSTVTIPAKDLVLFVNEKRGDDWRGVSLLRTAYRPYLYKERLQNIEAIALERSAGLPVGYPPRDIDDDDPRLDQFEDVLSSIRQGEDLWAMMPGPKEQGDGTGWLIEELSIKATEVDFSAPIGRYEAAMTRNVLAEFMRLGQDGVGARAVGDVQQDPYYQAVEALTGYVEAVINEQIVKPLIDWNYQTDEYPRVTSTKIQAKDLQQIASYFSALAGSGLVKADDELEEWLRKLAEAPEPTAADEPMEPEAEGPPPEGTPPPLGGDEPEGPNGPEAPGEGGAVGEVHEPAPHEQRFDDVIEIFETAEADDDDHSQMAMVALYPDPKLAATLAEAGNEDASQLHLTLAFLGNIVASRADGAAAAVTEWARRTPKLRGLISGVGFFAPDTGPGKSVRYASVDIPLLPETRQDLVGELADRAVPANTEHGFTPHITLAYGEDVDQPVDLDLPIECEFTHVTLAWGEQRLVIPLTGPEPPSREDVQLELMAALGPEGASEINADVAAAMDALTVMDRPDPEPDDDEKLPPAPTGAEILATAIREMQPPQIEIHLSPAGRVRRTVKRGSDGAIESIEEEPIEDGVDQPVEEE